MTLVVWAAAAVLFGFAGATYMRAAGPDRMTGLTGAVIAIDPVPGPVLVARRTSDRTGMAVSIGAPRTPTTLAGPGRTPLPPVTAAPPPEPVLPRAAPIWRPGTPLPGQAAMMPGPAGLIDPAPLPAAPDARPGLDVDRGRPLPRPRIVPPAGTALTLAAVGDIMIGGSVRHDPTLPLPLPLDPRVAAVLRRADLAVGNLEGVIGGAALTARGCGGTCYRFRMQPSAATVLADAGFDLLSLANNHADDFGAAGRLATRRALDAAGIGHAGHDETPHRVTARWVRDLTVGFVGFGHNRCCLDLRDPDAAAAIVADLQARHDIVVVMVHGGAEGVRHQRLPRGRETYLGIDRGSIFAFARRVVDAGADVVLGSGPHVPRALEVYRGRLIAYSLGNFWTTRNVSLAGPAKLAPILHLWLARNGAALGFDIISARQTRARGPRLDPADAAWNRIRLLTRLDFPDQPLLPLVMAMSAVTTGRDDPLPDVNPLSATGLWRPTDPVAGPAGTAVTHP